MAEQTDIRQGDQVQGDKIVKQPVTPTQTPREGDRGGDKGDRSGAKQPENMVEGG